MAKPQKKKPSKPSWFKRQVDRYGENFISTIHPAEIQRNYLNICRDIARGNIVTNEYQYLFNTNTIENVLFSITEEYNTLYVSMYCINVASQCNLINTNVLSLEAVNNSSNKLAKKLNLYTELLNAFVLLKQFIQDPTPKSTEDFETIYETSAYKLSRYKYDI